MLEPDKRKLPIALGGLRDSPGSPPARASPLHLPPPKCHRTSQLSQFNSQQVSLPASLTDWGCVEEDSEAASRYGRKKCRDLRVRSAASTAWYRGRVHALYFVILGRVAMWGNKAREEKWHPQNHMVTTSKLKILIFS